MLEKADFSLFSPLKLASHDLEILSEGEIQSRLTPMVKLKVEDNISESVKKLNFDNIPTTSISKKLPPKYEALVQ